MNEVAVTVARRIDPAAKVDKQRERRRQEQEEASAKEADLLRDVLADPLAGLKVGGDAPAEAVSSDAGDGQVEVEEQQQASSDEKKEEEGGAEEAQPEVGSEVDDGGGAPDAPAGPGGGGGAPAAAPAGGPGGGGAAQVAGDAEEEVASQAFDLGSVDGGAEKQAAPAAPAGGGTFPSGAEARPKGVTAAYRAMSPSQQAKKHKDFGTAMQGAADAATEAANEAVPDLKAEMKDEGLPEAPPVKLEKSASADTGKVKGVRDASAPVLAPGEAPKYGRSPVRPDFLMGSFENVEAEGADRHAAAAKLVDAASAGGENISTDVVPPEFKLEGSADPVQVGDAAAQTAEQAQAAFAEAQQAVAQGPGPEIVQLQTMDEAFEIPAMQSPTVDALSEDDGLSQFLEWDLPADIQAQFDADNDAAFKAAMKEAEAEVDKAQADWEGQQSAEIAKAEQEAASANQAAQSEQEKAVQDSRDEIQAARQDAVDKQSKAMAEVEGKIASEQSSVMKEVDSRISADQARVDKEIGKAQDQAKKKVKEGEKKAENEQKKAEEEEDGGFWGGVWDAVTDFVSAIVDAVVAIWDAVREAVTAILDAAVALAGKIIDAAVAFASEAIGAFIDLVGGLLVDLLDDIFPELAAELKAKLDEFKTWAQAKLKEIGESLKASIQALADGLKAALEAIGNFIVGALKFATAVLNAIVTGDWSEVGNMVLDAALALAGITREEFEATFGDAEKTIGTIIENPGVIAENAIAAVGQGFGQFGDNFWDHFQSGAIEWITGATGVTMPAKFDIAGLFSIAMQVLGISGDKIKEKITKRMGPKGAAAVEFIWGYVEALVTGGWEGLWEEIQGNLAGLWDTIIGEVTSYITEKLIIATARKIATMATGFGAIVEAIIAIWNFVMWLKDNIQKIWSIVQTVVGSVTDFISGNITPAANKIEESLAKLIPVALDLVMKLLGLGGVPKKVRNIIEGIQETVDKALDKLFDKVFKLFKPGKDDKKKENGKDDEKKDDDVNPEAVLEEKEPFTAGDESHHTWVEVASGGAFEIMVASKPTKLETVVKDVREGLDDEEQIKLFEKAKGEVTVAGDKLAKESATGAKPSLWQKFKQKLGWKKTIAQYKDALAKGLSKLLRLKPKEQKSAEKELRDKLKDSVDLEVYLSTLAKRIAAGEHKVKPNKIKEASARTLAQSGRALFFNEVGSSLKWLQATAKVADGGAKSKALKELVKKSENKDETTVTMAKIAEFATAIYRAYGDDIGKSGEFSKLFDAQVEKFGFAEKAKGKPFFPGIKINGIQFFELEHKPTAGGSESGATFSHSLDTGKLTEATDKSLSDGFTKFLQGLTGGASIPLGPLSLELGGKVELPKAKGEAKGSYKKTKTNTSVTHEVGAELGGEVSAGGAVSIGFGIGVPYLAQVKVTGELGLSGKASGGGSFKFDKAYDKTKDEYGPWNKSGEAKVGGEWGVNGAIKIEFETAATYLKKLWTALKDKFKADTGVDALNEKGPLEFEKAFGEAEIIKAGIKDLAPFIELNVGSFKQALNYTFGLKQEKEGDHKVWFQTVTKKEATTELKGLAGFIKDLFSKKKGPETVAQLQELTKQIEDLTAKVEELRKKVAAQKKETEEKTEEADDKQGKADKAKADADKAQSDAEAARLEAKAAEEEAAAAFQKATELGDQSRAKRRQIEDLKADENADKGQVTKLETEVAELQPLRAEALEDAKGARSKAKEAKTAAAGSAEKIAEAKKLAKDAANQARQARIKAEKAKAKLEKLETQLKEQEAKLDAKKKEKKDLEKGKTVDDNEGGKDEELKKTEAVLETPKALEGGGESHTLFNDVNGKDVTLKMASTPRPIKESLQRVYEDAKARFGEQDPRLKQLQGLMGAAIGMANSIEASAEAALANPKQPAAKPVKMLDSLAQTIKTLLDVAYKGTEAIQGVLDDEKDPEKRVEKMQTLADYAVSSGKDVEKLTDQEKTEVLKGHAVLIDQVKEGGTIRKIIPESEKQNKLANNKYKGQNDAMVGSVAVAGHTKGLKPEEAADSLGLDYDPGKNKDGTNRENPYYTDKSGNNYSNASGVTPGEKKKRELTGPKTMTVVEDVMSADDAKRAKVPVDQKLIDHLKTLPEDDPTRVKLEGRLLESSKAGKTDNSSTNSLNPYTGTGRAMGAKATGIKNDGTQTINQELFLGYGDDEKVVMKSGAKMIDVDENGNEKVVATLELAEDGVTTNWKQTGATDPKKTAGTDKKDPTDGGADDPKSDAAKKEAGDPGAVADAAKAESEAKAPMKLSGGGETHTLSNQDGTEVMASTPMPVTQHLANWRGKLAEASSSDPEKAKKGEALIGEASALVSDIDTKVDALDEGAQPKEKSAKAKVARDARGRLRVVLGKLVDIVGALAKTVGRAADVGKTAIGAGDAAKKGGGAEGVADTLDKTSRAASKSAITVAEGLNNAGVDGQTAVKVGKGVSAAGDVAKAGSAVAGGVADYQKADSKLGKTKAVLGATSGAASAAGDAALKVAQIAGNADAGEKAKLGAGAVSDAAKAGLGVVEGIEAVKDPKKSKADKVKAVAGATGKVASSGAAAGQKVANIAGNSKLGDQIATGGAAVGDLTGAVPDVVDAVVAAKDGNLKGSDKAKAIAKGVSSASTGLGNASEKIAGLAGNEAVGKKINAGAGAVSDLAGTVGGVADAYDAVKDPKASKAAKTKAVANAAKGVATGGGAAAEKIAGGVLGNEEAAKKAKLAGGAGADVADVVGIGADTVEAFNKEGATGSDKARAVLSGVEKGSGKAGDAAQKIATLAGNEALGGKLKEGAGVATTLAGGGGAVIDAIDKVKDKNATTSDKVKAVSTATGKVANTVGTATEQAAKLAGNEGVGTKAKAIGGAVEDVSGIVNAGVDAYGVMSDKNASKTKKINAGLDLTAATAKGGGNAAEKVMTAFGKGEQGKNVNAIAQGVGGVATSGKDVTAVFDTFNNKDATATDKVRSVANATKSVSNSVGGLTSTGLKIAGHRDGAENAKTVSGMVGSTAGTVVDVANTVDAFTNKDATAYDKVKATANATKSVATTGADIATGVGKLTKNDNLITKGVQASNAIKTGFGAVQSGFGVYESGRDAVKDFKEGNYASGTKNVLKAGGHGANVVKNVADTVGGLAKGPAGEMAKKVSGVAGQVGGGILGAASAVDNGVATAKDVNMARKLRSGGELGQKTKAQVNDKQANLARKWGIDTSQPGWEKKFNAEYAKRENDAKKGGEQAYTKFAEDGDVKSYANAKKIDDIRSYAFKQKVAGSVVKGADTAGDVASTVGTFTAGVDGGITKGVGTALKGGAMVARVGKAAYDRGERTSAIVEAEDVMKGYDKQGFIGKNLSKAGGAIKQGAGYVADKAKAAGSAIANSKFGQAVGGAANKVGEVAGKAWDGTKKVAGAVADKAKAAGGYVADKAKQVGGYVKDKAVAAGGYIADKAKKVGGYVADKAGQAGAWVKEKAGAVAEKAKGLFGGAKDAAGGVLSKAGSWIKGKASAVGNVLKSGAEKVGGAAKWLDDKTGNVMSGAAKKVGAIAGTAASKAAAVAKKIGGKAAELGGAAWDKTKEVAGTVGAKAKAVASDAWDKTKAAAKAVGGKALKVAEAVGGKAKELGGKALDKVAGAGKAVFAKTKQGAKWFAGKAASLGAKVKKAAAPVIARVQELGSKAASKVKEVGSKAWDATKKGAGKAWDATKKGAGKAWDATKKGAGKAWDATKKGASWAGDKIANSPVGKAASYVGGKAKAAGQWVNENIWQTSDMKWARKAIKFLTPRSSDAMLEETQEKFANNDKAKLLKDKDYAKYMEVEKGLGGNTQDRNVNDLLKMARGEDGSPEDIQNAREIFGALGVDPDAEDAGAKAKSALQW